MTTTSRLGWSVTIALVAWVAMAHAAPLPDEPTLPTAQWKAIQRVIEDQLRALKAGDAAKAFSFASPGIRTQFGTPDNFVTMVRSGYDALLAARYTEFLQGAVIDGRVIQPLRLVAPDNTVLVALYTMKKRVMSGWVTVTGPPRAICSENRGITLPALPNTLPKRTRTNCVPLPCRLWQTISASRFDAPITFVGLTALSVETNTNFSTLAPIAARASTHVP